MDSCSQLPRYYELFQLIVEDPRIMPKQMAKKLNHSGRGRSPSTLLKHVRNMYEKGISRPPRLTLKSYEEVRYTVYFCKKESKKDLHSLLSKISKDKAINYSILLSGEKFLILSRNDNLTFDNYSLNIREKSKMYTPIYTIPRDWNIPMDVALECLSQINPKKGLLPRTTYYDFSWSELDWKIFNIMTKNVRTKMSVVSKETKTNYMTVKRHFFNKVLPACQIAHYFYPKGFNSYYQSILRLSSDYETEIVSALQNLPCTVYVFPLERDLLIFLCHEDITKIIEVFGKMEEKVFIDGFLLYAPLYYSIPDHTE